MKDITNENENMAAEETKVVSMEAKKAENAAENSEDADDSDIDMYVKFSKPYQFEDETYEGLDMSCLENLNSQDLGDIEKKFYKQGVASFNPENTATYAKIVAQKATGLPIEFFEQLPIKDMLKIKSRVVNFFYN